MAARKKAAKKKTAKIGGGAKTRAMAEQSMNIGAGIAKARAGQMPTKVIESYARRLGRNARALGIYKRVLGKKLG